MTELEPINLGTTAGDHTGMPLRVGGENINNNFTELDIRTKNHNKIPAGKYQVFRDAANTSENPTIDFETNDIIFGRWAGSVFDDGAGTTLAFGQMVMAQYNSGSKTDFTNFTLIMIF